MHKVLLLGLGFWGNYWMNVIDKNPDAKLAGVAISPEQLGEVKEKYALADDMIYTDYKEAIAKADADIAVIVLPAVLHFDAATRAMARGINIIMEKPLAVDFEQAKQLVKEKAKYPGVKMMSSQNYRWRPHNQTIRKAILDGMIGKVQSVLCEFRQQEDLQGYRAGLAMPLLGDVCIHHFDLIRFYTGADCEEIYCRVYKPCWSIFEGKPNTEAIIKMEGDIYVNYNGSWAARGKESSWDGNFTITGEKGCLTLDANNDVYFYEHTKDESVVIGTKEIKREKLPLVQMDAEEMDYTLKHFIQCIDEDLEPETTLADNIKSFAMVSAGMKSVETGRLVKVSELLD